MEVMTYLEGEDAGDHFGSTLAALDFNGDGIDDLAVPSTWRYGDTNIRMYLGETNFDTQFDFTINEVNYAIGRQMKNLGDVNNDGKEDLGYVGLNQDSIYVSIVLGSDEQNTSPSFELSEFERDYNQIFINSLGDINGDNYDDVGITKTSYTVDSLSYYILWGGEEFSEPEYILTKGLMTPGFNGIGDINDDGYDDFTIGYHLVPFQHIVCYLYYGSAALDLSNGLQLWEADITLMTMGIGAGDINGDGYPDFGGHFYGGVDIWYGSEDITASYDIHLPYGQGGSPIDFAFDHGDLNNDGYSDLIIGSPGWGLNGASFMYLGGSQPNNTYDLMFGEPPGVNHDFGSAAVIGNFNGDEFDDIAISGPWETSTGPNPGYVYVFSGSSELSDYSDAEEEEIPAVAEISFTAYPNPFNPVINFEVELDQAKTYKEKQFHIEIYNVKGQRIISLAIPQTKSKNSLSWNAVNQSSGIYYCKLVNIETKKILSTRKVTLIK